MQLWQKQALFAENVCSLINYIHDKGLQCTFGEAYRTIEQATLYEKEGKGIADSLHCKRLAIDLNLFNKDGIYLTDYDSYKVFGEYWKTLNAAHRWGGDFKSLVDSNHFEMQDI